MTPFPQHPATFTYVNYKGVRTERRVMPLQLWYGRSDYYADPQWFIRAWDLDRNATRDFALQYILGWRTLGAPPDAPTRAADIP